ncbi:hypothetical protein L249_7997 [Ophiocordyceps polyrhachis-furcata BCC 54312]|uniref:Protein PBN1 n=1 Tax=Ophiocordyceps polyrhachis-furcata BCC 54312 TaxID=1330021 RepID=A0A367LIB7_9HYPO|nr:hypothetical protein L249_7997 [Ophiocordyceps polyrhachis-furcata BCC 54312]
MRERVTFVHGPEVQIDPSALRLRPGLVAGPLAEVVRQDRLTLTLDELPPPPPSSSSSSSSGLAAFLRRVGAVHLRWTSAERHDDALEPFCSRLPPGLWVSLTPLTGEWLPSLGSRELCGFLRASFGPVDCMEPEAFTVSDTGGRLSLSFYQLIDNLDALSAWAERQFCTDTACHDRLKSFNAVSLDISFDSTDQLLRVAASGPLKEQKLTVAASENRRTEVGFLTKHEPPNIGPFEIGLGGFLAVLGEDRQPSPTLFAFPSRHRLSGASFSSRFLSPTGLHPTLQLNLSTDALPAEAKAGDVECKPYAYLTLPKAVFADRYQLQDEFLLASKNLAALRHSTLPVDLEAPAYATQTWGSSILLELAPPPPPPPGTSRTGGGSRGLLSFRFMRGT